MLDILLSLIVSATAVFATAHILSGIHLDSFGTAVVVAIVLGIVNKFVQPLLFLLTLPLNILTLGLFTFVIIGCMVLLISAIVPGFKVDSFWWGLGFALVFAIINGFLRALVP